jgi:3-dehydroquinate synthase
MQRIDVALGARSYRVSIGHGSRNNLQRLIPFSLPRPTLVVSDRNVWREHGAHMQRALEPLRPVGQIILPAGERSKSRASLASLHDQFLEAGLRRDAVIIAIGGGVVGDVAGFAAATFMRGVDWLQVPTTLLAMVDSSVGGKVGINHPLGKNLIGAFHQPRGVIVDPEFLETLPQRQRCSGLFEIIKAGLIADKGLFESIEEAPAGLAGWDAARTEAAIAAAIRVKARIVEKDEREGGLRRVLNLGHTLGHALETVTGYRRFTHGEAVGWGMLGAAWLARQRGMLSSRDASRVTAAIERNGPRPVLSDLDVGELLGALARDKKSVAGQTHFILPKGIGRVVVVGDVTRADARGALRAMTQRES